MDSDNINISYTIVPKSFMPTLPGFHTPADAAAWTEEITRLEGLCMSPEVEQHWKPLLLREIATCVFLRHAGKCRDDIDISVALFEATAESGAFFQLPWTSWHLYHFCVVLRISFEDLREGAELPNGLELRRLEARLPRLSRAAFEFAEQLGCAKLSGYQPIDWASCLDESIALLRAAYTSSYVIGSETKCAALGKLAMALALRFHESSRAEDIVEAFEHAYTRFDVAPDSTDLLPTLELCMRPLRTGALNTLDLGDTICYSIFQRCRLHAILHKAMLDFWFLVICKRFVVTGRSENVDAFRLSVDRMILSEELPAAHKAKLLLDVAALLISTWFKGGDGSDEGLHQAASYLYSALSIPECPDSIKCQAYNLLHLVSRLRFSACKHLTDYQEALCTLIELYKQVTLKNVDPGATSGQNELLGLAETAADGVVAVQVQGDAGLKTTLHQLDTLVRAVHGLGAHCSSDSERAQYLRCAAMCHLRRFQVRSPLAELGSLEITTLKEDYAIVRSFSRELVALGTRPTTSLVEERVWCHKGIAILCELLLSKYVEHMSSLVRYRETAPRLEEIDEGIALLSSTQYDSFISHSDFFFYRIYRSCQLINLLKIRILDFHAYNHEAAEDLVRRATTLLADPSFAGRKGPRMGVAMARAAVMEKMAHPATLQAYQETLELRESMFSSAPALDVQFSSEARLSAIFPSVVAHALNRGELRVAVELTEQGKGQLWAQLRRFRTSADALINSTDARSRTLGEAFQVTSRELETLVVSTMPEACSPTVPQSSISPVSAKMAHKDRLQARLSKIVDEIRNVPGFEDFLRSPPFSILQQAASEGPVILVSCNALRSHALIVLSHRDPICVDLNHNTYKDLCIPFSGSTCVSKMMLIRRVSGPASRAYHTALEGVLAMAAKFIVGPVIDKLERLGFKPGTGQRIWWCPVGTVCLVPFHAAGPFVEPYEGKYLPDLYVSSYTPSLSALIAARAQARTSSVPLSDSQSKAMLIVGQPSNPSLMNVNEELCTLLSILPPEMTPTLLLDEDASPVAVGDALNNHSWLHIASHGIPNHRMPTESAFELSGDNKLTLREIIKLRLPLAQFAFLSACSTAEFDFRIHGSKVMADFDEVFHMSAAMLFCGFRGVVGTMWTVNDEDGVQVARHFYRELSRKGGEVMQVEDWDPRDAAFALNKAARKLKKKLGRTRGSLERWVNFIHVGM